MVLIAANCTLRGYAGGNTKPETSLLAIVLVTVAAIGLSHDDDVMMAMSGCLEVQADAVQERYHASVMRFLRRTGA